MQLGGGLPPFGNQFPADTRRTVLQQPPHRLVCDQDPAAAGPGRPRATNHITQHPLAHGGRALPRLTSVGEPSVRPPEWPRFFFPAQP